MNGTNISIILTVFIAIVSGAVFIGQLDGRMKNIENAKLDEKYDKLSKKLKEVANKKITDIEKLSESSNLVVRTKSYSLELKGAGRDVFQKETLWPEADACFLTKISGRFGGDGELVEIVEGRDIWYLQGHSMQKNSKAVKAGALCIKYKLARK